MKKIAVVILNWNGKRFLEKYLPSLLLSVRPTSLSAGAESGEYAAAVYVADNGSTDGSEETIRKFKDVSYIPLEKNWGFPGGYNRAFKKIDADYFVLLNSDVLAPDRWLSPLFTFMEAHPEVGICQPKMLSLSRHLEIAAETDGNDSQKSSGNYECFEYAGASGGFIDKWGFPFCRGRILSGIEKDEGQYNDARRIFWASGACMMVRSSLYNSLGGLDESFFAHMEEIDFCWRAALSGSEVWVVPQSFVYHLGGGTLPNNSPRKLYLNYRNNLLMLRKNLPRKGLSFKLFVRKSLDLASAVIYILEGKFSYAGAVFKAHREYGKMKLLIINRKQLQKNKEKMPYGIYPHSIILKFFLGCRKFADLQQF